MFVTNHTAVAMFAGELAPFPVEGVAVAVAGRLAKHADMPVVLDPAELTVVGDIAPDEVAAHAVPGDAFCPEQPGVQPLDGCVADLVFLEALVQHHDVGIRITNGLLACPISFGGGGRGPRRPEGGSGQRGGCAAYKRAAVEGVIR